MSPVGGPQGKGSIQPRVNTDRDTVSSAMSQNVKYLLQNQGASETREGLIWAGSAILAVLDALQNGQPAISFANVELHDPGRGPLGRSRVVVGGLTTRFCVLLSSKFRS